jgi:NAD(P)-dependent dehydrogenase (short-subunit alcohol dehydrogenase family)
MMITTVNATCAFATQMASIISDDIWHLLSVLTAVRPFAAIRTSAVSGGSMCSQTSPRSARASIEDMKEQTYEQVFRTNFLGTAFCCQAVLKQMGSQKSGHIVNIASGGAITPCAGLALYGAAKAAVIQFSKVLAFEEAKNGIVVTIVAPGPMHTAMRRESGPTAEDLKQLGGSMPLGRPCYPKKSPK